MLLSIHFSRPKTRSADTISSLAASVIYGLKRNKLTLLYLGNVTLADIGLFCSSLSFLTLPGINGIIATGSKTRLCTLGNSNKSTNRNYQQPDQRSLQPRHCCSQPRQQAILSMTSCGYTQARRTGEAALAQISGRCPQFFLGCTTSIRSGSCSKCI
jgi:hypothetical protein